MKKSFLSVIALFAFCMIHSQDSTNTYDSDQDNPLLNYDWSAIGTTPYIIGKKTYKNTVDSYLNLDKTIDNFASVGSLNYPKAASSISEMPVYKPKGIHKIKVFEIDSTNQFYLRIYKVN